MPKSWLQIASTQPNFIILDTTKPLMENMPETRLEALDRRIKQVHRAVSFVLLIVLPYVFTDFFNEEVSDYDWSMILFLRTIISLLMIDALVASFLRGEPLNVMIYFISVGWNLRYLNLARIGYLHSLNPTVLDYFAIIRSFAFDGML